MNFDEFIKKWINKICFHPKGIAGQCVCLYRCYLDDVLNVPQTPSVRGAKDLWLVADSKYFDKIKSTTFSMPKRGDIIIFDSFPGNTYGHVGMVDSASYFSFTSFDSNWSIPKIARLEKHSYKYVIGWLRPKTTLSELDQVRKSINPNFLEIYNRVPVKEDNDYYLSRIGKPMPLGIHTEAVLRNKMKYWASQPHEVWLAERKKVLG